MPIRPLERSDVCPLRGILEATKVFRPDEIDVAQELMEFSLDNPGQDDYEIYSDVDERGSVLGYYCIGATPMTEGTYDLYWIASDPALHGTGVGSRLLHHCEDLVRRKQGRLIVVETSSQPSYDPTRTFYARRGYKEEARIRGYYKTGDDLVIYTKNLKED
jgi:ribosomal protein S18 acetylase RimI-like enzyme